ncbi:iron-containing alcohol dehydrogenase [bacterium AH-315-M05]|nr:iron-containing alcohol dehydrogenase [bacterium AH-315-M05]
MKSMHTYSFPTDIRFGAGVIKELTPYLKGHNLSSPLIVTDPNVAELGFFKRIVEDLKKQQLEPEVFSDIHKNPVKSDVLKGGDTYHRLKRDSVIGIGGGAAMDVARSIVLRVNHHRDLFDYDDLIGGSKHVTEAVPHFVTVPTTSGTGSEVGRSAIISEDETKKKRILFHPKLMAKMVFADPELTYELPPFITAATGMDALTHNMEAFLAKGFNPLCDGIALEGIKLIFESLENAVNKPDPESRSKMMIASLMGAVAFQKGLGVVHSLAHPLSTLLDMHHGLANAICIPYGMQFNISGQEDQFKRIAYAMGLTKLDGDAVIDALFELNQKIGLPAKLGEQGVKEEHVEQLTDLAVDDFCHPNNPRKVTREDFKQLYLEAL